VKKFYLVAFPVLALLAPVASGVAHAQYQPRVSPYINLGNRSAPPGIIYYGIIRPEVQLGNSLQQLQAQVQAQQAAGVPQAALGPLTTGHAVGFLNHSSYFLNVGGPGTSNYLGTGAFGGSQRAAPTPLPRRGR
jgi:hypothetical protein